MQPIIYRLPRNIKPDTSYSSDLLDYEFIDMNDTGSAYALVSYKKDTDGTIYEYADIYGYGEITANNIDMEFTNDDDEDDSYIVSTSRLFSESQTSNLAIDILDSTLSASNVTQSPDTSNTYAKYSAVLLSVNIANNITSICNYAFNCCESLTDVDIHNCVNLTSIGTYAFSSCASLISIDMSNCTSLATIGAQAFLCNSSLTSVILPDSVTSISDYVFGYCTSLTSIDLSNTSIASIGNYEFFQCTSLSSVTLPDSVTSISDYAFIGCASLTSINIPSGVVSLDSHVFMNNTQDDLVITIDREEDSIEGAPWGATNATIVWNG